MKSTMKFIYFPEDTIEPISLENILLFSEAPFEKLTWTITSPANFQALIVDGKLEITPIDAEWRGTGVLTIEACNPSDLCTSEEISISIVDTSHPLIIHTQNAGFIIMAGGKKIAIDTMGESYRLSVSTENTYFIENSLPPFNDIDLLLVTHDHNDHFSSYLINTYLSSNPETVIISTRNAIDSLLDDSTTPRQIEDQVYSIDLWAGETETVSAAGITVEVFYLSHGIPAYQNYGFLFTLEGITFFHSGDFDIENNPISYLHNFSLEKKGIDIAFIPYSLIENDRDTKYVMEGINPKYMVPMHLEYRTGVEEWFGENTILIIENLSYAILTPDMFED
jgi:L-ascorbate metabolism protein UlaG (beta-lactamase superfamily)